MRERTCGMVRAAAAGGAVMAALGLGGCSNGIEGAFSGAALGAGGGAIIGSLYGEAGTGAAIGAVSGALLGGVIGDQNQRNDRNAWRAYEARTSYSPQPAYGGWHEPPRRYCPPPRRYERGWRRY